MIKKIIKRVFIVFFFLIIIFSFFLQNAEAVEVKIICTNSVLSDFTSNIIKDNVTIEYIMPSGVCPAYYDCPPSDVIKITSSDILISFGDSKKEPWLSDLLIYNPNVKIIECKDLGEWNIPSGAKQYVKCISTKLSEIFPDLNTTINENSEKYIAEINNTEETLLEMIEENTLKNKKVISMQWQKDFIEWLGLNVVYSYGPPQGLSVQDELDIITIASENDVYAIVDNLQSGTDFGSEIASKTGITQIVFTNFPGAIPGTQTYIEMITYNTKQLIDGIKTHEFKQGSIAELESQILDLEFQRNIFIVFSGIFILIAFTIYVMYKKK